MGNLIKEWVKEILVEEVKQEVVVYAGRFQPFHAGHYATYEHLVKKFGKQNVFVGTSNQQGGPRHPFNFKEKREIMMKMFNIPSSQIVQVKNPYQPSEVLNKFDSKTTAFITVVGEKDEARLGGKYFKKYDGKPESGYIDQGYVYVSPMQKNSISGTDVRNWLSASDDSQRKAGFKKAYPKFDPKIYNLISTRLMKIESVMESFFKSFDVKSLLEGSTMNPISLAMVDNGPAFSWTNKERYEKANNEIAKRLGFEVVDWILGTDLETQFVEDRPTQVSYYPKSNRPANRDYSDWKSDIEKTATAVGIEFINFLDKKEIGLNEDLFGTSLKMKPYETLMVKSVISFMMDKFNFKAKIIVKKKDKAGLIGDISLSPNSVDGNKFYLHFNPNQSYQRIIQSMIHELTHVKQVSKKELLPNKDYTAILWNGKEYITAKDYNKLMKSNPSEYMKLPWEVEAVSNMKSLYPQFIKSKYWLGLKGKDATLDYIIDTNENVLKESLLVEGGAYGHMAHPFDTEMNLTFGDLKQIINGALTGELELAREKTDGQALAISWRDDKGLIAARNKGHLANRGEKALDISGIASKFGGRGGLTDAYNFAMKDLTSAIKGLSKAQRDKIFKQGAKFMNLEVIWPTSVNVIPYGQALLIFHNTTEYNEAGVAIGSDQSDAKILAGMIKQINQTIQSQYTIQGPPVAQLPKSQKLTSLKSKFDGQLSKLQKQFNLKDTDGVAEYHQKWWENFVDTKSPSTLDNKTKMGLVKRWAFYDKGFRLDSKNIEDPKVLSWAQGIDKNDHAKIQKDNIRPFEDIFLGVGSEVLSFMSSVITANPDTAVRSMKDRLDQTVKDVQKGGDPKKIAKLKLELQRLAAIGGKDKIVPNEGIVFVYKGNTYKLTGTFAPLNQILGLFYGD
jgi:hypothetical protein